MDWKEVVHAIILHSLFNHRFYFLSCQKELAFQIQGTVYLLFVKAFLKLCLWNFLEFINTYPQIFPNLNIFFNRFTLFHTFSSTALQVPMDEWFFLIIIADLNGHSFQDFCLENSIDRGAWWAMAQGITKELDTTEWLSTMLIWLCETTLQRRWVEKFYHHISI